MDFRYFSPKMLSYIIFSAVCWTCIRARLGERARGPLRSIGGRDAQMGEFPYVVRLEKRVLITIDGAVNSTYYENACTGSALSATATLTAHHCCIPKETYSIHDKLGKSRITGEEYLVVRYGSVPGPPVDDDRFSEILNCLAPSVRTWMHSVIADDIALLITQPIVLRSYARISGRDYHTIYGHPVTIAGYGATNSSDGKVIHDTLELKKPLQIAEAMWIACRDRDLYRKFPIVCAVEPCGQHVSVCGGDSGGPVLLGSEIVGIVHASHGCVMDTGVTRDINFAYFVPTSVYIDWIADVFAKIPNF